MMLRSLYLLLLTCCLSCSVVSKQYYYVPDTTHTTLKDHAGYFKMVNSQFAVSDTSGKHMVTMTINNGVGIPLFIGPPYLPVAPLVLVSIFDKRVVDFQIDISIFSNDTYFISTPDTLKTDGCYMIINGSKRIPLTVKESQKGNTLSHYYRLSAPIRFAKIRTLSIITGNPLLDNTLKNMTFRRKKRLTHCVLGLS